MTNTPKKSLEILETRPGVVVQTDVAEMNFTSIPEARYFATIIDEVFGHLGAYHVKTIDGAAELLKRHIM